MYLFFAVFISVMIIVISIILIQCLVLSKATSITIDVDVYDEMRCFKHDFSNIMQVFGGYLVSNDYTGLHHYFFDIYKDYLDVDSRSKLNFEVINNPSIYSILADKVAKSKLYDIEFKIEVLCDLSNINMNNYELSKILAIFIDNSIEATRFIENKIINILITRDIHQGFDMIVIENSCIGESIDLAKIFQKNFTTKKGNSGIGLWEVNHIVDKYDNVDLNTVVENNIFRHCLRIFYK